MSKKKGTSLAVLWCVEIGQVLIYMAIVLTNQKKSSNNEQRKKKKDINYCHRGLLEERMAY
jgi:RNAse (barnase) inhibitor barstar